MSFNIFLSFFSIFIIIDILSSRYFCFLSIKFCRLCFISLILRFQELTIFYFDSISIILTLFLCCIFYSLSSAFISFIFFNASWWLLLPFQNCSFFSFTTSNFKFFMFSSLCFFYDWNRLKYDVTLNLSRSCISTI